MAWPKLIVCVRHAESEGNIRTAEERTTYELSTHQYPLTARGEQQARITGEHLRAQYGVFDVYYTSYYARSKQTMALMYPEATAYEDPRLAEAQRGIYHILTSEQLKQHLPWELERRAREGFYHHRPLGGENWPDVELRIHSFLSTMNRDCEGKSVLIVVHGNWLILLQRLLQHFSIEEAIRRYHEATYANASVTVFEGSEMNGKSRLVERVTNIVPWHGLL